MQDKVSLKWVTY